MIADSAKFHNLQVSYDVSSWTEPEVASWVSSLDIGIDSDVIDSLTQCFLLNHINGRRLLMLTATDLCNLGVQSVGYRVSLIQEIQRLCLDNERLINFPPLSIERNGSQSRLKVKSTVQLRDTRKGTVNMTLLYGFYVRASPATLREMSDGSKYVGDCEITLCLSNDERILPLIVEFRPIVHFHLGNIEFLLTLTMKIAKILIHSSLMSC